MKSERRHDLEANELVIWIEKFKPYAGQATAVVAVIVALFAIRSIWNNDSTIKQEEAWEAFALASETRDIELKEVLAVASNDEYENTTMPEWAHVTWADRQLLLATQMYLSDRSGAHSRLKKIEGVYMTLAKKAADSEVQNRAIYGLARIYELQDKLDEAILQYSAVQGDLATLASQRATQLDSPDVQEACAWLATADLPRPASASNPGGRPSFDAQVPAAGNDEFDPKMLQNLLGNLVKETEKPDDRYNEEDEEAAEETAEESVEESVEETVEETPASDEPASEQTESEETETPAEPAAETSEPEATEEVSETTEGQ